jgi:hypothetical protein
MLMAFLTMRRGATIRRIKRILELKCGRSAHWARWVLLQRVAQGNVSGYGRLSERDSAISELPRGV